jgi:DNA repair exonuclease SbcCD nuclease subunit
MINKIIAIADIHIRTFKRHDEYHEQFDKFFKLAKKEKPDRIVIAGDIVHQKIQMSPELIDMVTHFLNSCAEIAKTIVLIGNHDFLTNNMERLDALSPVIEAMKNPNIQYFNHSGCHEDENVVWVPISLMDDNKLPECFDSKKKLKDKKYIGVFHSPVSGISTDLGFSFGDVYSLDNFNGLDVVIMGDIHKHQLINKKNPLMIMCGSFCQQSFGETVNNHGYVVIDVEKQTYKLHHIPNDYGYYQFKVTSIEDIDNNNEVLTNE